MLSRAKNDQKTYSAVYASPIGPLTLYADGEAVTGLLFPAGRCAAPAREPGAQNDPLPVLKQAFLWMDVYFLGRDPGEPPPLRLSGTAFQRAVWQMLQEIPYGTTVTYGELAAKLAEKQGKEHGSARAVGGAVGRNPAGILVPCHRVVGAGGSLTGFGGGIAAKQALLRLEGVDLARFTVPTRGAAL